MLNFEYKGISYGKYVEGEIEALNNSEAAHKLKEQKVIITKLVQTKKKKEIKKKEKTSFSFGTGVKAKDILVFCKQFATMLRAGLPVLNTLEMLIGQTASKGMKTIIETIKKDLESGNALSKCFENLSISMVALVIIIFKSGLFGRSCLIKPIKKSMLRFRSWASSMIKVSYFCSKGSVCVSANKTPSVMTLILVLLDVLSVKRTLKPTS